jgi:hypothetical protein
VFGASGAVGVRVAWSPEGEMPTRASTGTPPAERVKVAVETLPGSIGSLKVATTLAWVETPVEPPTGSFSPMLGATWSGCSRSLMPSRTARKRLASSPVLTSSLVPTAQRKGYFWV